MDVIPHLATSKGLKDEAPNIALAEKIAKANDGNAVDQLVELINGKEKTLHNDSIKVLYEVGERKPALIADHLEFFVQLLSNKNNRLQWGGMTALNAIAKESPGEIFKSLPEIAAAGEKGSVITMDNFVFLLINLYQDKKYESAAVKQIMKQLSSAPENQLPMYAEKFLEVVLDNHMADFVNILGTRLPKMTSATKAKRVEKVIQRLKKQM